jgi:ferredoxin
VERNELQTKARELGIDLVGVTTRQRLDRKLPVPVRPSRMSEFLDTFLVFGKKLPRGVSGARSRTIHQQQNAGLIHRSLEEAVGELGYWLEGADYLAVTVPSLLLDFKTSFPEDNTPAGQGSTFLRLAAVEAGLGTLGLNQMLLTPQFGPRVYLAGMMTDWKPEPDDLLDDPLKEELCPGLQECGRCAAICPEQAIPSEAPEDAPLVQYRGLDSRACARSSQPAGVFFFVEHLKALLQSQSTEKLQKKIFSSTTRKIWHNMAILRQGAFAGCIRCMEGCPVGEDYTDLSFSPHRQQDLPAGVSHSIAKGLVRIQTVSNGPGQSSPKQR